MKKVLLILIGSVTMLLVAGPIAAMAETKPAIDPATERATAANPESRFEYAVKFLCGASKESPLQVVKGVYASAINVHNPAPDKGIAFEKTVAIALPKQRPGPISRPRRAELGPNQAFEIDCADILQIAGLPTDGAAFVKGFVVIVTPSELDVTAVYSARPTSGQVSALEIKVISPRVLR